MPNGGYVKENGITLCPEHHLMAESFHMNKFDHSIPIIEGFLPSDMYKAINSSYSLAYEKSEKLK